MRTTPKDSRTKREDVEKRARFLPPTPQATARITNSCPNLSFPDYSSHLLAKPDILQYDHTPHITLLFVNTHTTHSHYFATPHISFNNTHCSTARFHANVAFPGIADILPTLRISQIPLRAGRPRSQGGESARPRLNPGEPLERFTFNRQANWKEWNGAESMSLGSVSRA